jgi:hypothetical protein
MEEKQSFKSNGIEFTEGDYVKLIVPPYCEGQISYMYKGKYGVEVVFEHIYPHGLVAVLINGIVPLRNKRIVG